MSTSTSRPADQADPLPMMSVSITPGQPDWICIDCGIGQRIVTIAQAEQLIEMIAATVAKARRKVARDEW